MNNSTMLIDPTSGIEMQEIIEKLKKNGHENIVQCLIDNESDCYTKKSRLNKSGTCRKMGWKNKQLEDALEEMRELLKEDFDFLNDEIESEDDE